MKTIDFKQLLTGAALGLFAILGTTAGANAQRHDDRNKDDHKRQERLQKEQDKAEKKREAEWNIRNARFQTRTVGTGYYTIDPNTNVEEGRYRVNRDGRWYNIDNRDADRLRDAINEGYRQGFAAGRADRNGRRRGSWNGNNVYRSGSYGYQGTVAKSQYQYYFRQGFQRGYQDGSNSQYRNEYNGDYQYGSNNGGNLSILGSILNQILSVQRY